MNSQTDEDTIRSILRRYEQAVNEGDLETWLSLWDKSAIRMVPNAPAASSIDEIRASAADMFAPNVTQMAVEIEEVIPLDNWAIGRGTYIYTVTPGGSDQPVSGSGKYLSIFGRQPDGNWKFARDCFNEDSPP